MPATISQAPLTTKKVPTTVAISVSSSSEEDTTHKTEVPGTEGNESSITVKSLPNLISLNLSKGLTTCYPVYETSTEEETPGTQGNSLLQENIIDHLF